MSSRANRLFRCKSSDLPAETSARSRCSRRRGGTDRNALDLVVILIAIRR